MTQTPPTDIAADEKIPVPVPQKSRRREWTLLAILLIFALVVRLNFRQGRVSGDSMEPSYHINDTVLIWTSYPRSMLKPGDVVIFRDKKDELIKRIVLIKDWQDSPPAGNFTTINGGRQIPYALLFDWYFRRVASGIKPKPPKENRIYVFGDNLPVSDDSRSFGPISPDQILGKVVP